MQMFHFNTPCKHQKTSRLSDVFRGCRNGTLRWNRLKCCYQKNTMVSFFVLVSLYNVLEIVMNTLQETADLVRFAEEISNGKLHFLCNDTSFVSVSKNVMMDSKRSSNNFWDIMFFEKICTPKLFFFGEWKGEVGELQRNKRQHWKLWGSLQNLFIVNTKQYLHCRQRPFWYLYFERTKAILDIWRYDRTI